MCAQLPVMNSPSLSKTNHRLLLQAPGSTLLLLLNQLANKPPTCSSDFQLQRKQRSPVCRSRLQAARSSSPSSSSSLDCCEAVAAAAVAACCAAVGLFALRAASAGGVKCDEHGCYGRATVL